MSEADIVDDADEHDEDLIDDADEAEIEEPEDGEEEGDEAEEKVSSRVAELERLATDKGKQADKERNRRRAAEQRARDLGERLSALESRAAATGDEDLLALIDSIPDDDDDPIGKIAAVTKALKAFRKEKAGEIEADTKATQQQAAVRKIVTAMEEYEADFSDDHPDYAKAAKHYKAARREELAEMGYAGQVLERELANDLLGLASRAINSGRDPAEAVYNLAKKRGYAAGKSGEDTEKKLQKIAEGVRAGRTPPGGKSGSGQLTYASVSALKGAAFDAGMRKLREQERRAG